MTKRLILIRHAKSSWDAPFDDHARTLNDRGRAAAAAIGRWLKSMGYVPGAVLTSDAARTLETTDLVVGALGTTPEVTGVAALYHASSDTLLETLRTATADTVAVIAHNPGIAFFAEEVVTEKPDHPRFFDFPTGATLVCDFPITNWADAQMRSAQVVDFIVPKDLEGGR